MDDVVCEKCQKKLKSIKSIKNHKCRTIYTCEKCEKKYNIESAFQEHIYKCTGKVVKTHYCQVCDSRFRTAEKYKNHACGEKQKFFCVCEKVYKTKTAYAKHQIDCLKAKIANTLN
jgi:hypothetical protein